MGFDHRRTVTYRLSQAARIYRARAGAQLQQVGLHSGQESLLKALSTEDGMSMSDLATTLGVQPPTITKMISRLAAQDHVERRAHAGDGRQADVFLTDRGRVFCEAHAEEIDAQVLTPRNFRPMSSVPANPSSVP